MSEFAETASKGFCSFVF